MTQDARAGREPPGGMTLDGKAISRGLALVTVVATVVQVLLGASWLPLLFAATAGLAALATFAWAGALNCGAWLVFFFAFGNVLVALWSKTLLGQTLESRLYDPISAFATVGAGTLALIVAFGLARMAPVGKPIFRPGLDPARLKTLSWGCFVLGISASYLHNELFINAVGRSVGGFAIFKDLLYMATIARTALLLERSGGRRSIDLVLCGILLISVFIGLLGNSKTAVALPLVSHFTTVLFYRKTLSLRTAGTLAAGTLVFVLIIGPLIHVYRGMGIHSAPITERVALLKQGLFSVAEDAEQLGNRAMMEQFSYGYYEYFGGGYGQMLLGRYASVQQVDPVVATVNQRGTFGRSAVVTSLLALIPSFLYPEKPRQTNAYWIVTNLGLIHPDDGDFPTVPLVAQSYAAFGITGLAIIPFVTFLAFMLTLKKLGWTLDRNVYSIFFFCQFLVVYTNQGDLGQYVGTILRGFPPFAVVFILLGQRLRRSNKQSFVGRGAERPARAAVARSGAT